MRTSTKREFKFYPIRFIKTPKTRLRQAGIVVRQLMLATPQAYELMWVTRPGPAAHDAFTQLIHIVQYGQVAGVFIEDNPRKLAEAIWAYFYVYCIYSFF